MTDARLEHLRPMQRECALHSDGRSRVICELFDIADALRAERNEAKIENMALKGDLNDLDDNDGECALMEKRIAELEECNKCAIIKRQFSENKLAEVRARQELKVVELESERDEARAIADNANHRVAALETMKAELEAELVKRDEEAEAAKYDAMDAADIADMANET